MKPHLHFMGIGGISMSGLARWYHADGYQVSGCDGVLGPSVKRLRHEGISVAVGHSPDHLNDVDVLVSTMAVPNVGVPNSLEEVQAADTLGLRNIKRIELLADLFEKRRAVGVTGTHGKSTTSGMLATIFVRSGLDPSVQLGATLPLLEGVMRYGAGEHLIAEVDESDPGFAHLKADIAVLTNLEDDHVAGEYDDRRNYHASLIDLENAARTFARSARRVVYCADWDGLEDIAGGLESAVGYGFSPDADYKLSKAEYGGAESTFTLTTPEGESAQVALAVPGKYNVHNAAAALTAAHLAGIGLADGVEALEAFNGVGRRWQRWGNVAGTLVIDDYAHHPTEVAATLTAAKNTGRRVRAVLQPHRWIRTARHWPALADAAAIADEILVLDIYSAGEAEILGISPDLIVNRLKAAGRPASYHSFASAQSYLRNSLQDNDLVITLGAGDVWRVAADLVSDQTPVTTGGEHGNR